MSLTTCSIGRARQACICSLRIRSVVLNQVLRFSDTVKEDCVVKEEDSVKKGGAVVEGSNSTSTGFLGRIMTNLWPSQVAQPSTSKQTTQPVKPVKKSAWVRPPVSREELDSRIVSQVFKVRGAYSSSTRLLRVQELSNLLSQNPQLRSLAIYEGALKVLLRFERSKDLALRVKAAECIALLGHVQPPMSNGFNLLSIDGGGTRGMIALEILETLEQECNKRIYEMFDLVVGVSTGSVLAALLCGCKLTVSECRNIYREMSTWVFDQNRISGVSGLIWAHSYYNTSEWQKVIQEAVGKDKTLLDTIQHTNYTKLSLVSCLVNRPRLESFVFRNYHPPHHHDSIFPGSVNNTLWQALQASAAAPGYFEEVNLDGLIHQDGGVMANNPTGIGIHECRSLWPYERMNCIVSVGNGRSAPSVSPARTESQSTSLRDKLTKIVDSATDTEMVHYYMNDVLPDGHYFRLNPYVSHAYTLDEADPYRLELMQTDAQMYIRRNMPKIRAAASQLLKPRSKTKRIKDFLHRQSLLHFDSAAA